jgi:hypothetical protein
VTAMPEAGEVFEVHWVTLTQALVGIDSGEYSDGKTGLGIFKAARALRSGQA